MNRRLTQLAGVLGFTGVALGAFGAHALKTWLQPQTEAALRLSWWETATRYHLLHAVALLGVAVLAHHAPGRLARAAAWLFTAGIALFSGSLYVMTLTGDHWLGRVTPLGGVSLLAGWVLVVVAAGRQATAPGTSQGPTP